MNRLKTILLIASCISVIGCSTWNTDNSKPNKYHIIDTINVTGNLINWNWSETVTYPVLFIGNLIDSVFIDRKLTFFPPPPLNSKILEIISEDIEVEDFIKEEYDSIKYKKQLAVYEERLSAHPLIKYRFEFNSIQNIGSFYVDTVTEVKVDTSFIISKLNQDEFLDAYPVIISNNGVDTMLIGYEGYLRLTVEAKDSLNKWKKIIDSYETHGLHLHESTMLIPGSTVIVSTFKTSGDYKTKLRIKIGNNISNTWTGNINYNQFNSKFDEKGGYKTEYLRERNE